MVNLLPRRGTILLEGGESARSREVSDSGTRVQTVEVVRRTPAGRPYRLGGREGGKSEKTKRKRDVETSRGARSPINDPTGI